MTNKPQSVEDVFNEAFDTVDWHKKSDRQTIRQYKLKLNKQNVNLNKVKMDF